jgi:hypothetical protein
MKDYIRDRLQEIREKLDAFRAPSGYFIGDESEAKFRAALRSGDWQFSQARRYASNGLAALEAGNEGLAEIYLRQAEHIAAGGLEAERNVLSVKQEERLAKKRKAAAKLNKGRKIEAADRLELLRREYREGETAEHMRQRLHNRPHEVDIPKRTIQEDLRKIRAERN